MPAAAPPADRSPPPAPRRPLRRLLRWGARLALALVALVVLGAAGGWGASERRLRAAFAVPEHPLPDATDPAALARGARLATVYGCTDCHGADLGGRVVLDDPLVGRVPAPNLTSGGRGAALAPRDWERAIRHGVRRDGRPLVFMPAHEYAGLADDEVAAIVAHVRRVPPVARTVPPLRVGPLGRALHLAGELALVPAERVAHAAPHPATMPAEPTPRYGAYLAAGCVGCHGETYAGGRITGAPPDWPPAANLTPTGLGAWREADFVRALREGIRPDGRRLDPVMPVRATAAMTDVELRALWAFLRTLPARETGAR